jgi:Uma2 family endonuclease
MSHAASPSYTAYEKYLALESSSDVKHEWCDGVVYAMSRGTPEHARLSAAMVRVLGTALSGECTVYSSDAMLWIDRANLSTYADATIVCGPLETKNVRKAGRSLGEAIVNPTVVVEMLSESTERYDRDAKFQAYKQLTSLTEYVLVAQDERRLEVYRLRAGEWACETSGPGGRVSIHGQPIEVDEVYR